MVMIRTKPKKLARAESSVMPFILTVGIAVFCCVSRFSDGPSVRYGGEQ